MERAGQPTGWAMATGAEVAERGTRPADRRDRILAAARRRFAEFGFGATTVRQIADDVGMLSGSLYHHFATKEDMLSEIVRGPVLAIRDTALRIAALPCDAETRLVTLIAADLAAKASDHATAAIVYNERKFFRRSPDFAFVVDAKRDSYEAWAAILEEGKAAGLFDPALDGYLAISTIGRMLNTGADWYVNEDGSVLDSKATYSLDELLGFYLGFVLRAIRAPARAGEPVPAPLAE